MSAITIRRNASRFDVTIEMAGRTTVVDMSAMPKDDRGLLVRQLFAWRERGYTGYPNLPRKAA